MYLLKNVSHSPVRSIDLCQGYSIISIITQDSCNTIQWKFTRENIKFDAIITTIKKLDTNSQGIFPVQNLGHCDRIQVSLVKVKFSVVIKGEANVHKSIAIRVKSFLFGTKIHKE